MPDSTTAGKKDYRIVAFDLDETLIPPSRVISERDRAAIREATARGVDCVIATGRGYMTVQGTLRDIGLWDTPDSYTLSYNGGIITENKGNRVLYQQGITWEQANALYTRGQRYDVCMHVYTQTEVYVWHINDDERAYLDNRQDYIELDDADLGRFRDEPIIKVLYEHNGYDYLRPIEAEVADITADMEVSYSSGRYLEFNCQGVSKGASLLRLADILGVDPAATIAIGDNVNDLSMIRAAGLGVGVGNVDDQVRPYCDYVCERTCEDSAVAEVIERFVLS
ncbi:MAG: HAD-IIB family hydrolase [Olegusella sp.]|nr:HAD-IIB family hydrolase [Olegusella sp.]